jgi:hypothetical protein
VRAGGSGRHANPRARKLAPTSRSFEQRMHEKDLARPRHPVGRGRERAELLPVMDAAVAAARLTSELRSLQMARRAERRHGEAGDNYTAPAFDAAVASLGTCPFRRRGCAPGVEVRPWSAATATASTSRTAVT